MNYNYGANLVQIIEHHEQERILDNKVKEFGLREIESLDDTIFIQNEKEIEELNNELEGMKELFLEVDKLVGKQDEGIKKMEDNSKDAEINSKLAVEELGYVVIQKNKYIKRNIVITSGMISGAVAGGVTLGLIGSGFGVLPGIGSFFLGSATGAGIVGSISGILV